MKRTTMTLTTTTTTTTSALHQHQHRQQQLNDEENNHPRIVDELLSKELLQLSVNDRNGIQEEIHGVGCLAPEEDPFLVENSLKKLSIELDELILPAQKKLAYLQSQQFEKTYVNKIDFRLRFLRCELFDIHKTALRICEFLELVLELFGEYALQRPIRLSDFNKEELKEFRKGRYQFLPYRDRSGRKILSIFVDEGLATMPLDTKAKIALYTSWAAGCNDVDTQRKGLIFLVWFDKAFKISQKPQKQHAKDHQVASVRASAIHCCTPDTAFYRFRRSVMTMRIASHNRSKLKVHLGESVENRYTLETYGIPAKNIPLTWSGTIKVQYVRQWIRLRQLIEERQCKQLQSGIPPSNFESNNNSTMIECPNLNDVLFRQGTSTTSHPGNATFRGMIGSKLRELELELEQEQEQEANNRSYGEKNNGKSKSNINNNIKTRKLVLDIIEEIKLKRNGRVLFWNETGWWDESNDEDQIYLKVEYIVREFRLNLKRKIKAVLGKPQPETTTVSSSRHSYPLAQTQNTQHQTQNHQQPPIVNLKSGTAIFLETQDGLIGSSCSRNKRQRLISGDISSDDDDDGMIAPTTCVAECFGMKFIAC